MIKKMTFKITADRLSKNFLLAQMKILYTTRIKIEKKTTKESIGRVIALGIIDDTIEELKLKTKVINKKNNF